LAQGLPFLGICVGYQLLFEGSDESPGVTGFGFLKGRVRRFSSAALKVPQIGWNSLDIVGDEPFYQGTGFQPFVFFVHSFYPVPEDVSVVTATATYGDTFAASIACGKRFGTQYHPEKSQNVGLRLLKNFVSIAQESDQLTSALFQP
jgi:imidazole glycerol-phosphate synthase subunit HisH